MSINRIVVLLSPIFVGLSGWVVTLVARYLPGHPQLDRAEMTAVFIAGATWAAAHLLLWLRGWQKHEQRLADAAELTTLPPPVGEGWLSRD